MKRLIVASLLVAAMILPSMAFASEPEIKEIPKTWIFITNPKCEYEDQVRITNLIHEALDNNVYYQGHYGSRYVPFLKDLPFEVVCFRHADLLELPKIDDAVRLAYPESPLIWLYDLTPDLIPDGTREEMWNVSTPDGIVTELKTTQVFKEHFPNRDRYFFEMWLRTWGADEEDIPFIEGLALIAEGSAIADNKDTNAISLIHEWTHIITCKGHIGGDEELMEENDDYHPDRWISYFRSDETRPWCIA